MHSVRARAADAILEAPVIVVAHSTHRVRVPIHRAAASACHVYLADTLGLRRAARTNHAGLRAAEELVCTHAVVVAAEAQGATLESTPLIVCQAFERD